VKAPVLEVYEFSHLCDADAIVEASVGSVLQVDTESLRSPQAGCVALGTPEVEIALIHLCEAAASDSTPPKVVAEGFCTRAVHAFAAVACPVPPIAIGSAEVLNAGAAVDPVAFPNHDKAD
jgi:hypothetical protein